MGGCIGGITSGRCDGCGAIAPRRIAGAAARAESDHAADRRRRDLLGDVPGDSRCEVICLRRGLDLTTLDGNRWDRPGHPLRYGPNEVIDRLWPARALEVQTIVKRRRGFLPAIVHPYETGFFHGGSLLQGFQSFMEGL